MLIGVKKIHTEYFTGKLSGPERNWTIVCVGDARGCDIATICYNDILLVKSDDCYRVAECEFM